MRACGSKAWSLAEWRIGMGAMQASNFLKHLDIGHEGRQVVLRRAQLEDRWVECRFMGGVQHLRFLALRTNRDQNGLQLLPSARSSALTADASPAALGPQTISERSRRRAGMLIGGNSTAYQSASVPDSSE